ncbi:hypothetical protein QYE76_047101 [Lolium multiflorum]|uniref:Integrase catalytic domain-containing protein n=1 Tax=Lolium multiflorum TaxID=4521 RepID=A0AAD8X1M4_LOLMU|nr:hypothetical protein QYE76_047101 [Lolium multiflorum]
MGKQGENVHLQQDPRFDNSSQPIRRVGSAGAHRHDGPMDRYPVDDISEKTNCELHQPMKNISLRVATSFALACEPGARWHGSEIEAGASNELPRIIEEGYKPYNPNKLNRREEVDNKLNSIALNMIQTDVGTRDLAYVRNFTTAKEAWEGLSIIFMGSESMKRNKYIALRNQAEGFMRLPDEDHHEMYRRLITIADAFLNVAAKHIDDFWIKDKLVPKDKRKDSMAPNKKFYIKNKKNKRPSRIVLMTKEEYSSDDNDSDSDEETSKEVAAIATTNIPSSSLFESPNENPHIKNAHFFMARSSLDTSIVLTTQEEYTSGDDDDDETTNGLVALASISTTSSSPIESPNENIHMKEENSFMAKSSEDYAAGGSKWVLDSGCTSHMTGGKNLVKELRPNIHEITVSFGDNSTSEVLGFGKVVVPHNITLVDVMLLKTLGYNLLSVSALGKMGFAVFIDNDIVVLLWIKTLKVAFVGYREHNLYVVDFSGPTTSSVMCLFGKADVGWLWHRRLAHVNMRTLKSLHKGNHIMGLMDNVSFAKDRVCRACVEGKMHDSPHPSKTIISSKRILELLHVDLFGPTTHASLGAKKHSLVIVDDYSRYTWVYFLKKKYETQQLFIDFATEVQHQHNLPILAIRSDNGSVFKNYTFNDFLSDEGIRHQYSAAYTPQQNGVAERKNRTLMDMARSMMAKYKSLYNFWDEAISTACNSSNRLYLRKGLNKTAYEILTRNKPNISYFKVFGSLEGIFVGYGAESHTYRVFEKSSGIMIKSCSVTFEENDGSQVGQVDVCADQAHDDEQTLEIEQAQVDGQEGDPNDQVDQVIPPSPTRTKEEIEARRLRRRDRNLEILEHTHEKVLSDNFFDALEDSDWLAAMHDEVNNFKRHKVWSLVEKPKECRNVIGTKWIFNNKQDEHGIVVRNKARFVAQGYSQIEGIDFGETYAPVAHLESIRILLAYASHHNLKLQQIDVKSAFLNGPLHEEVYVKQPRGFEDPEFPNHIYKLDKALYGLKQAPRAWYEHLKELLIDRGFDVGIIDPTLFTKRVNGELFVCQLYVDDIIFGSTNKAFNDDFSKLMTDRFEMSMMGEMRFFLGFEIKKLREGTFINQAKYLQDMLEGFKMTEMKGVATPMVTKCHLALDPNGKEVDQKSAPRKSATIRRKGNETRVNYKTMYSVEYSAIRQKNCYENVEQELDIEDPRFWCMERLFIFKDIYEPKTKQFFATLSIKKDEDRTMQWMSSTSPCQASFHRFAELLGYPFSGGQRLHGPQRTDKDVLFDLYTEEGAIGTITELLPIYDHLLRFFRATISPSGGNNDAIRGALVDLLRLSCECAQDGDETRDFTVDVMDYIFHEIFNAMVSRTSMPYAPYIQLLINDTVVAEDLSQFPFEEHKFKKAYIKRKKVAPVAGSFMGDARSCARAPGRSVATPLIQREVKKLNWFQRNVLCMNIEIHKENFQASRQRANIQHTQAVILHKLSGEQGPPPHPPVHPTYSGWYSSQVQWSDIEQSLLRSSISRASPPAAESAEEYEFETGSE